MKLLIVIVNYRSAALTVDCLHSLESEVARIGDCEVVVVENASGEGETLQAAIQDNGWSDWCTLMDLAANRGFAAGNNAAIEPALASPNPPDYILLLNPDTVVRENAILPLVEFMQRTPKCGIAGSRLEDPDGTPQRSAFRFPSALGELENASRTGPVSKLLQSFTVAPPCPEGDEVVDWVAGASMLVRREVFEKVGLMDEEYFLYYEEVDFCKRVKNAGWECWYVPQSRVVHLVGQSSGVTNAQTVNRRRPQYWFESRRRYFELHGGPLGATRADVAWMVGGTVHALRCCLTRRPLELPERFLRDLLANSPLVHPLRKAGKN